MTRELESMKQYILSTGRAEVLLERGDFLLVEWRNVPNMPERYYRICAFPYARSGMGNSFPWSCPITSEQAEYFLAHPDDAERFFKYMHPHFGGVTINFWSFDDIADINEDGILFKGGHSVCFKECVHYGFPENRRCIGERNITAKPPFIEFHSPNCRDRVRFDKRGLFSAGKNERNFHELLKIVRGYGYLIFDLS